MGSTTAVSTSTGSDGQAETTTIVEEVILVNGTTTEVVDEVGESEDVADSGAAGALHMLKQGQTVSSLLLPLAALSGATLFLL